VLFLSTVYTGQEFEERIRRRPTTAQPRAQPIQQKFGAEPVLRLPVPSISADYNDQMGGVDIGDQLRAGKGLDHRVCRGNWRTLAWTFLLETALVNSYLLQLWGQPSWPRMTSQREWRQRIIRDLCEAYGKDGGSRRRFRAGDVFTPITQHKHVTHSKGSRCVACQGFKAGQPRSQSQRKPLGAASGNKAPTRTRKGCSVCNVAICTSLHCWDFYHGLICE
jgi:hypothetical protein